MMQYFWWPLCFYLPLFCYDVCMHVYERGGEGGRWDFYFLCNWAKKTVASFNILLEGIV